MTTTTTTLTLPACPTWCEDPARHGYDSIMNDGTNRLRRGHDLTIGSVKATGDLYPDQQKPRNESVVYVDLLADEIAQLDGTVDVTAPTSVLNGEFSFITADEARQIAALLISAADRLELITSEPPTTV